MKTIFVLLLGMISIILTAPAFAGDVPSLEAAIKAWAEEATVPQYKYAFGDLNEDGIDDAVVLITGNGYCGSGGCALVIFKGIAGSYKLISYSTISNEPILLLNEKRKGWHTLSVRVAGGGIEPGQVLMRFNGTKYPLNPTMQAKAKQKYLNGATTLVFVEK